MTQWYWMQGEQRQGPCSPEELRQLAESGQVHPETLTWREGLARWVAAGSIKGLFPARTSPVPSKSNAGEDIQLPRDQSRAVTPPEASAARSIAAHLNEELRSISLAREIVPIDKDLVQVLLQDSVFWGATLLGVIPLLIITLQRQDYQLTAFALFFALVWGWLFRFFILKANGGWRLSLGALFFTGLVGIPGLLMCHKIFPNWMLKLPESDSVLLSFLGMVFSVGVFEELCKAVPVVVYLAWNRGKAIPERALLIGIFSGLGFGAFENLDYTTRSTLNTYLLTERFGAAGLGAGVRGAMINVLLRSLSLVFAHALWAGIVSYFLVRGLASGRRQVVPLVVGLMTAAILHGTYNWLTSVQPTFAALVIVVSFVLFYAYVLRLRSGPEPTIQSTGNES